MRWLIVAVLLAGCLGATDPAEPGGAVPTDEEVATEGPTEVAQQGPTEVAPQGPSEPAPEATQSATQEPWTVATYRAHFVWDEETASFIAGSQNGTWRFPMAPGAASVDVSLDWNGSQDADLYMATDDPCRNGTLGLAGCLAGFALMDGTAGYFGDLDGRNGDPDAPATVHLEGDLMERHACQQRCLWEVQAWNKEQAEGLELSLRVVVEYPAGVPEEVQHGAELGRGA